MPDLPPVSIGIDFGTSNTVIAVAGPDGPARTVRFAHDGALTGTFMSALCFWQEPVKGVATTRHEGGPWAVDAVLGTVGGVRFIQSFKSFAASASFRDTHVFGTRMAFEDLLATFLGTLRRHAGLDLAAGRIVMGRPVRFAGAAPDDGLAMARYAAALDRLGLRPAACVYEPVGAAFADARSLDRDATLLVADFGGGTSDFSVIRVEAGQGGRRRVQPLGHAGIGIAGDTFDARIVDHVVAPRLGKHTNYVSFGKSLDLPVHLFSNLARWNQLSMMKSNGDLRELRSLARSAERRDLLEQFIEIVEYDMGFALYRAVAGAKRALSTQDAVDFRFREGGIDIGARIARADFEAWIADDLARIAATVDRALADAAVRAAQVDRVFLTGGTALVPAIRRLFAARFGAEKLASGDHFESIAAGLALIGREPDLERWAA